MTKSKDKLGIGELSTLEWMLQAPMRHVISDSQFSRMRFLAIEDSRTVCVSDREHPEYFHFMKALGTILSRVSPEKLLNRGFVNRYRNSRLSVEQKNSYDRIAEKLGIAHGSSADDDKLYVLNNSGIEWFRTEGKIALAALREKQKNAHKGTERLIIIGSSSFIDPIIPDAVRQLLPSASFFPIKPLLITRPAYIATVFKEGKDRLYVKDVKRLECTYKYSLRSYDKIIKGSAPDLYVSAGDVIADNASEAMCEEIMRAFHERLEAFERTCEAASEATSILLSLRSRDLQSAAMYSDIFKEIVEKHGGTLVPKE